MAVVVDCNNNRLALWRLRDGTVWKHLGPMYTQVQFSRPRAVAVTGDGALVVSDHYYGVQILTVDGITLWRLEPTLLTPVVGSLGYEIRGLIVCAGTDEIIFTDYNKHRLLALTWSPSSHVRKRAPARV